MGATPLPAQIMPLPSSSRLGVWGERSPPMTLESAMSVVTLASGSYACARALLAAKSSARLLWPNKMSLGLESLASCLEKVENLRVKLLTG